MRRIVINPKTRALSALKLGIATIGLTTLQILDVKIAEISWLFEIYNPLTQFVR